MEKDYFVFWRRIFACIIDYLILFIIAYILTNIFFEFFVKIGNFGILTGFLLFILYFGIQNSFICNGQTIGERIFRIKVVNINNDFLSVQKSILRASILSIPLFFINKLYIFQIASIYNEFVFALSIIFIISSLLLFIFNKPTRQMLHDLLVKSYVIDKNSPIINNDYRFVSIKFFLGIIKLHTFDFKISQKLLTFLIILIVSIPTLVIQNRLYTLLKNNFDLKQIEQLTNNIKKYNTDYNMYAFKKEGNAFFIYINVQENNTDKIYKESRDLYEIINKTLYANQYKNFYIVFLQVANIGLYQKFIFNYDKIEKF